MGIVSGIARKVFGSANDRLIRTLQPKVDAINALEAELEKLTDAELKARTDSSAPNLPPARSSTTCWCRPLPPCAKRPSAPSAMRHFDVQLVGGMILHRGAIAEMRTGEGKTLVATLAVYLNALAGKGVHVVTVNDYLARRDADWMGKIYSFLGMSVGVIVHGLDDNERRAAYGCDITYGTNNEFGFDYLRDNMKFELAQMVQRGHNYAIVDEVNFDPRRRSAHAADHFRSARRQVRTVRHDRQIHSGDRQGRLRPRRKAAHGHLHRIRQREARAAPARRRAAQGRIPLRRRKRRHRPPHQQCAEGAQDVCPRQGLYRAQRRNRHHRRIHRPHDAGPTLFGRAAPGARGQGGRRDPAREPDAGLDHLPELFPPLCQARRHDRHGDDGSRRVHGHLQARRRRRADQPAGRRATRTTRSTARSRKNTAPSSR